MLETRSKYPLRLSRIFKDQRRAISFLLGNLPVVAVHSDSMGMKGKKPDSLLTQKSGFSGL
jgi:hypothetical protein